MGEYYSRSGAFQTAGNFKSRFVNRRSLFHQFRAMGTPGQIICYWLCPAEPARSHFTSLIGDLAARFDAPIFESHVTLYVTNAAGENPESVLKKLVTGREEYRLTVSGVGHSDQFTKTLFVQFEPNPELTLFSKDLRRASSSPDEYQLNPHLSLIYKNMDQETQRRLAASIMLPFAEVIFDTVKAIISQAEVNAREDVEAWRVVAEEKLRP